MADEGMLSKEFNESLRKTFLKGHFDQCLNELLKISRNSENFFILENNKIICESLIDQASYQNDQKNFVEALLKLYDNYYVGNDHLTNKGPLHVRLTILFNCHCLALSTIDFAVECDELWDRLIGKMLTVCQAVGIVYVLPKNNEDDSWSAVYKSFLDTIGHLSRRDIKTMAVYLGLVLTTVLIRLRISANPDLSDVVKFLKCILKDAVDYTARESINHVTCDNIPMLKFDFNSKPSTYEDACLETTFQYYGLAVCALSVRLNEMPCRFLKTNYSEHAPFWFYCEGLRSFSKKETKIALGHLLQGYSLPMSLDLQCRYHNLLGRVYSDLGERQKAVKNFTKSLELNKSFSPAHYYQGREFSKMGMVDSMLKSYHNLVYSTRNRDPVKACITIEYHLLKILSEHEEISSSVAIYLLAFAYGINEMFHDAQSIFEKILTRQNLSSIIINWSGKTLLFDPPNVIVVLHEAATMNLATGNLSRAEEICREAINLYPHRKSTQQQDNDFRGSKDLNFLLNTLQDEFKMEIDEPIDTETYYENYLSIFEEDIVGILLLAELRGKGDSEEARLLLNQAMLLLSKYIARVQKDENKPGLKKQETLIKALTCKTCLHIAKMQTNLKPYAEVDKMFKRALSCNNGDKDVLYFYTSYLLESGKQHEAEKLWSTFSNNEPILNAENSQSLALRYILRTHVSQRLLAGLSIKMTQQYFII